MQQNILITGGAGFIGSNFISFLLHEKPGIRVVNLDKLTYAGNLDNLAEVENLEHYHFVHGDICDKSLVKDTFDKFQINGVIHFAAESHVDNSINSPDNFIHTNILGTFVLLEATRRAWSPSETIWKNNRFLHISTDEVFGSLGAEGFFSESTPYAPNSPYSASKASSDFLARSYHHTYGLNLVTSNCSNNYGPKQHDEKLIPTIIRKALAGESIPIYGDGSNVRDWLYVADHCRALQLIFDKGKAGETYAIGGNNEHNNLYIALEICKILDTFSPRIQGSYRDLITFVRDRPGHDQRYAIDSSHIRESLGWVPKVPFQAGLQETVHWYIQKYQKI